jgi:hypothetical protein
MHILHPLLGLPKTPPRDRSNRLLEDGAIIVLLPKRPVQLVPTINPDATAAVESTLLLGSAVVPPRSIWTVQLTGDVGCFLDQHASSKGLGNAIKLAVKILRRANNFARVVKQLS